MLLSCWWFKFDHQVRLKKIKDATHRHCPLVVTCSYIRYDFAFRLITWWELMHYDSVWPHPWMFSFSVHAVGGPACESAPLFNDGLFIYCVIQEVITGKPQHSWNVTLIKMFILILVSVYMRTNVGACVCVCVYMQRWVFPIMSPNQTIGVLILTPISQSNTNFFPSSQLQAAFHLHKILKKNS